MTNKKCTGCGAVLQHYNEALEGYVKEEVFENADICERCFRIKNYGDYKCVIKDNNTFLNIIKDIPKNDLVVLVMDLFNLPKDVSIITNNINNPILLVLTKRDILPKIIYEEKLLDYIDKYNLNYKDKIIVDKIIPDELLYTVVAPMVNIPKITYNKTSDKIYVVGFTNAGKSTLINKLIYNYSNNVPNITTSMLPSTTLNSIEIRFDDNTTFIDTPGLLSDGSVENIVDVKTLKKIVPKREIRPITYQVKCEQWICIENLVILNLKNNNITLFISNSLKIDRFFKEKENKELVTHEVDIKGHEDLVINGLGFIKFTKNEHVKISVPKEVSIYVRKSLV